jgi:hypothetical protein
MYKIPYSPIDTGSTELKMTAFFASTGLITSGIITFNILIAFLFVNMVFQSHGNNTMMNFSLENGKNISIDKFEGGNLRSIEFKSFYQSPDTAFYFSESSHLKVYLDWKNLQSLRFYENGKLKEKLYGEHLIQYNKEEKIQLECIKEQCIQQVEKKTEIPKHLLQPGDILFLGNPSHRCNNKDTVFTHVCLIAEVNIDKITILENSLYSTPQLHSLKSLKYDNYLILRHPELKEKLKDYLKKISQRPVLFCTNTISSLVFLLFPELAQSLSYFQACHPDSIALSLLSLLSVAGAKFSHYSSVEEFQTLHTKKTKKLIHIFQRLLNHPEQRFWLYFTEELPWNLLTFNRDNIDALIELLQSSLPPSEYQTLNPNRAEPASGTPICIQIAENKELCTRYFDSGILKAVEIFPVSEDHTAPYQALFFYPDGKPMNFLDNQNKLYLYWNRDGNLEEYKNSKEYYFFADKRAVTKCHDDNCQSLFHPLAPEINDSALLPGDVIFSGSIFPYSGRFVSPITHISIFAGINSNGEPIVISNNVYETPKYISLKEALKNTVNWIILRNPDFQKEFLLFLENQNKPELAVTLNIPHFCANLFLTLSKSAFKGKMPHLDRIDKNFPLSLLIKMQPQFETPYYELESGLNPETFIRDHKKTASNLKQSIKNICAVRRDFLYQLFYEKFFLLPIEFQMKKIRSITNFTGTFYLWGNEPKINPEVRQF